MSNYKMSALGLTQLQFEKKLGKPLLLHGPTIDNILQQYASIGGLIVANCTFPAPDLTVKTEDKEISPGLTVRIYTPPNYAGDKPVCVFMHGGGWAMGDLEAEDGDIRAISKASGVVIVSVGYRLAPAHKYPAGLEDSVAAYHWALKNAASLGTTPNQAFTWGTSAGGNLALSVALKLIDTGYGDTLKGVVAVVPVTVLPDAVPEELKSKYTSYDEHAEHTIDTASAMKVFIDTYGGSPTDPYVSPLLHKRIKDLPKVYLVGAEMDTLRDDARLLKQYLDDAGVPNIYDEFAGYPHFFWAYPSPLLADIRADYSRNLLKGFKFVLS